MTAESSWSARATSACRWRCARSRSGHDVVGFDVDKDRVDRLRRPTLHRRHHRRGPRARPWPPAATAHRRRDGPRRVRHRRGVGADTAARRRTRPELHRGRRRDCSRRTSAPGALRDARVDHLPGNDRGGVRPLLEAVGRCAPALDFHLGYSPERIDPSNSTWGLQNTPKIVSGVDDASRKAVAAFYGTVVDTDRAGRRRPRGRAGEAAGEHLPARQHRPGQRAGDVLPTSSASTSGR